MTAAGRPRGFLASLDFQDRQRADYLERNGLAPTPMSEEPSWPIERRAWWRLLADEIRAWWCR